WRAASSMMRSRWTLVMAVGVTTNPPLGSRAIDSMMRSTSAAFLTGVGTNSTPSEEAIAWISGIRLAKVLVVGLIMNAARSAPHARPDFLEHRDPLAGDARLHQHQAGKIPTRSRQARDEARVDRFADADEHDRGCAILPLQCGGARSALRHDHIRSQRDQLFR